MQRKECHLLISHPKAILISMEISQTRSSNAWYCLLSHKWQAQSLELWGYSLVSYKVDFRGTQGLITKGYHLVQSSLRNFVGFKKNLNPSFHQFFRFFFLLVTGKIVDKRKVTSLSDEISLSWISSGFFSELKKKRSLMKATLWCWPGSCSHEHDFFFILSCKGTCVFLVACDTMQENCLQQNKKIY